MEVIIIGFFVIEGVLIYELGKFEEVSDVSSFFECWVDLIWFVYDFDVLFEFFV